MKLPKARNENIAVQTLKDEVLIYDLITNQAFCLNETLAKVLNACDGRQTFEDLKSEYKFTDEIIYLALDGLQKQNLLTDEYASPFAGMNRREVIKKVGLASMIALPVISSLVAPTAANAQSGCLGSGQTGSGSFPGPFGGSNNSETCINTIKARCCSRSGSGGCSCNLAPGAQNVCSGSITCV